MIKEAATDTRKISKGDTIIIVIFIVIYSTIKANNRLICKHFDMANAT
jgi:hypothetical protein